MNIKDFKPGQEAYTILEEPGRNTDDKVSKVIVVSIGRKYVKAASEGSQWTIDYYSEDDKNEYLTENKDWGDALKLFPSKQDLGDYIEKKMTYKELWKKFEYGNMYDFTLDQLRAIKKIVEVTENGRD